MTLSCHGWVYIQRSRGPAHYPSDVTADGGGPVYYQQQVLATVPRADFGTSF